MGKVAIGTPEKSVEASLPPGFAGSAQTRAYFAGEQDPLHLHLHCVTPGQPFRIGPLASDCAAYVWQGEAWAGDVALPQGSSLIVEHGASLEIRGGSEEAVVATFTSARPPAGQPSAAPRAGGHVHLLPASRVPRYAPDPGSGGTGGGLHANAGCPTCEVWLHENSMPGMDGEAAMALGDRGVHSHSEDEIIFVTGGMMRLGTRLVGPGTALAIAADTMYSFTPGPDGLSFINFRAARPRSFRMKDGTPVDEEAYWRARVSPPEYVSP